MLRIFLFLLGAGTAAAAGLDTSLVRESGPLTPAEEQGQLKVPEGFTVQLFAAEPLIHKPINVAPDARGRLWVTSSYEYPYGAPVERWSDPEGTRVPGSQDGIFILEDTDGDGKADKKTVFANELNIPTGVLPWKNGCIAWSIPNIWFFEDTDGDDVCDRRTLLFGPLGWEKDVHGNCSSFREGPDGWIYGTHGFSNTSHFKVRPENLKGAAPGDPGTELKLNSGNVYRFRPDGSRIELFSAGQVNPFGLGWDRFGHLYSADCHSAPIYQLLPGAVYPSFGKPHDGLGFGPVMIQHTHSSTGICGLVYLDQGVWGPEWDDRVLIGNVVTSRINHDRVTRKGTTPQAHEEPDFLTSNDPWFRPVDLRLGPAGELYVADFYNKIIGHYEVPLTHPGRDRERGRIWKITKNSGVTRPGSMNGAVAALRFAARRGPLGPEHLAQVEQFLKSDQPEERRVAVEALLQPVSVAWIPRLLAALEQTPAEDESLRHQWKIVFRAHLRLPGAVELLESLTLSPALQEMVVPVARAAGTRECAAYVFRRLKQNPGLLPDLRGALTQLAGQLPAVELTDFVRAGLPGPAAEKVDLLMAIVEGVQQLGELPPGPVLAWGNELASELLSHLPSNATPSWQHIPSVPPTPSPWGIESRTGEGGSGVMVLSSLASGKPQAEQAMGTLQSRAFPAPPRLRFQLCGHDGEPSAPAAGKNYVRLVDAATGAEIQRAAPPRQDAARWVDWDLSAIAGISVRMEITDGLKNEAYAWLAAGDFQPPVLQVQAWEEENRITGRLGRLAGLLKYAAPPGLRDRLAAFLPPPPPAPPSMVTPEQQAIADQLVAVRAAAYLKSRPNVARGAEVYAANCAICHAVAGKGALVGPQLDGIGSRGAARLAEDILDPGRNVDAHFRLHIITLKDGSVRAGLERGEAGAVLILVDAAGQEHRIPKAEIQTNEETSLSLMPASFADAIPEEDFHHLLAWLLEQRAG